MNTLLNCVDYTDEYTLFSDYFSAIALSPAPSDALGVHRLYYKALNEGSVLPAMEPLARPFLRSRGGDWEHVAALGCESFHNGWTQMGATAHYLVKQHVRFLDVGTVRIIWEIESASESNAGVPEFCVLGAIYPRQAELVAGGLEVDAARMTLVKRYRNIFLKKDASFFTRMTWHFAHGAGAGGGFRSDEAIPSLAPSDTGWKRELQNSAKATWCFPATPHHTETGWRVELTIALTVGETLAETPEPAGAPDAPLPHFDYASLPAPLVDTLYWRRKMRQAFVTIMGAGVQHPGYGTFSDSLGIPASITNWSSSVWFWDHFIGATVIGAFQPQWMKSAVRGVLRHTSGGRKGPGILLAFPTYGPDDHMMDCYAPVASWAVMKAWKARDARPDLETIYPLLAEHHTGWFTHCDRDGDGIPEWRNSGNPADDSPRFDPYAPTKGAACFPLPPFPSADLCAYLLMDARCLAEIARELGRDDESANWEKRAALLRRQLVEKHWDATGLMFHDLTPDGKMYKVKTFFGLLPLWADPQILPAETAVAAIRKHLLNPAEFWGDIPFPSVAYDEPTYDPVGYWRGRTWGHVYFWNTEILRLHGFHEEAEEACRRYLRICAAHKEPMENFPSDPALLHKQCVRSYTWCGSALVFFLLGWHRKPIGA
jgi:hypothetical protein